MSEDLPTLERPMKAYSGRVLWGQDFTEGLLCTKVAECINIVFWVLVDERIGALDQCTGHLKLLVHLVEAS